MSRKYVLWRNRCVRPPFWCSRPRHPPVLVMHGDDQIVPYADSGPLTAQLLANGTLKTCHGFPRGRPTTQAETINADILTFLQS